ncbi:MAG: BlaI/MecI/CopY family transcriptional regulator [Acidobacteriia bacterium]|nr:BlaI/MecI/CopY family transcriptional regulator [Terriglobia bacterium]
MMEPRRDERLGLPPGALQREVLEFLWSAGECSVWDVVDRLGTKLGLDLHYNTVSSTLNNLCSMGLAHRVRASGARAYLYSARLSREQLEKAATTEAVRTVFEGSRNSRLALSYLVDIIKKADSRLLDDVEGVIKLKRRALRAKRKR